MVDGTVSLLAENLTKLLAHEVKLLRGVEGQVRSLQNELRLINVFLKRSEEKRNQNDILKEVVNQIKDVAHEAEDVIDMYIVEVVKQRRRHFVKKLVHSFDHANMLRHVASNITSIKNNIREIYNNRNMYQSLEKRREHVEEDDVVGYINDTKSLVKKLTEGTSERDVVSIICMGGLGKTTLAKRIYNNTSVKNHFSCRAWVYVSQEYSTRKLLLSILKCLMPISEEIDKMPDEELKTILKEYLSEKRYLVVMDDIWETGVWDEVKESIRDESKWE